jgi:hypothetical protein
MHRVEPRVLASVLSNTSDRQPVEDPKAELVTLIEKAGQIKSGYEEAKAQFERGAPLGEFFTEASIDLLKSEFGFKKKYTRPLARGMKSRWEMTTVYQEKERDYRGWCNNVAEFLDGVSIKTANLRPSGNSQRLLRRWYSSQKGKRLDTRLNHSLRALESMKGEALVYNKDIPALRRKRGESKELLIHAGRRIKAESELENLLSKETSDYLKICDPYVSKETLKYLEVLPEGISVKMLTAFINNSGRFKKSLDMLRRDREIHVLQVSLPEGRTPLHDRYFLTRGKGWIIGTSLKDVGKKDTTLSRIEDIRQFEERFDSYWGTDEIVLGRERCSVKRL